jgi:hypothetical protein
MIKLRAWKSRLSTLFFSLALLHAFCASHSDAAELPLVRIAHGAFSEKIAVMWVGAEQGIFRKHGVHVEVNDHRLKGGGIRITD